MSNESARARLADLMESVQAGMASIARVQQEQARLTATATGAGRRITATVNAHGVLVELKFTGDIEDLPYADLAREVVAATQAAAIEVQRKTKDLLEDLKQDNARIPRLSEFVPGIPDVHDLLPTPPEVSMAAPDALDRKTDDKDAHLYRVMEFTDVETTNGSSRIADPGDW